MRLAVVPWAALLVKACASRPWVAMENRLANRLRMRKHPSACESTAGDFSAEACASWPRVAVETRLALRIEITERLAFEERAARSWRLRILVTGEKHVPARTAPVDGSCFEASAVRIRKTGAAPFTARIRDQGFNSTQARRHFLMKVRSQTPPGCQYSDGLRISSPEGKPTEACFGSRVGPKSFRRNTVRPLFL